MTNFNCFIKNIVLFIAVSVGSFVIAADPVVSNVRALQRTGTSLLDITYDLADADSSEISIRVEISTNNGVAWLVPTSSNLTGAVGKNIVEPGNNRTIIWDGGRELPPQLFPFLKAKIMADDTPPLYLVIDLSGGTNAVSYPVSYLSDIPVEGWTDTYKTTKLVLRKIPKATFVIGSPSSELGGENDETQHTVTLSKDFYIGVFEVTQRQWELVMGNKPSYFNNATYYASRPVEQVSYFDVRENPANSDDPAVNWPSTSNKVNATSFMGKLRAKTGLSSFDLPTEVQWEYACRAGTTTALNSGYNLTNIISDASMNVLGRYKYDGGYINGITAPSSNCTTDNGTAKAGTYLPNAWGLYDMHGNVWEWCLDWYGTYPVTVTDPLGQSSGTHRVFRGGGWNANPDTCRSAQRNYSGAIYQGISVGFRAARTMP